MPLCILTHFQIAHNVARQPRRVRWCITSLLIRLRPFSIDQSFRSGQRCLREQQYSKQQMGPFSFALNARWEELWNSNFDMWTPFYFPSCRLWHHWPWEIALKGFTFARVGALVGRVPLHVTKLRHLRRSPNSKILQGPLATWPYPPPERLLVGKSLTKRLLRPVESFFGSRYKESVSSSGSRQTLKPVESFLDRSINSRCPVQAPAKSRKPFS